MSLYCSNLFHDLFLGVVSLARVYKSEFGSAHQHPGATVRQPVIIEIINDGNRSEHHSTLIIRGLIPHIMWSVLTNFCLFFNRDMTIDTEIMVNLSHTIGTVISDNSITILEQSRTVNSH